MLDLALVADVLARARGRGAPFADLFVENRHSSTVRLLGGRIVDAVSGHDYGAGLRTIDGNRAVYAYTNDLTREGLLAIADAVARGAGREGPSAPATDFTRAAPRGLHPVTRPPSEVPKALRATILRRADAAARGADRRIAQVDASLLDHEQHVLIANTEGLLVSDNRVRSRLAVQAIAEDDAGRRATGSHSPGASQGFEFFDSTTPEDVAAEAARSALAMLPAGPVPAGSYPVVIGNGFGGVIFHEACGHLLETTAVAKKASVLADRLGERIAPACVTAWDDGTIPNAWGGVEFDDEGMPSQRTLLIENGVLNSYIVDRIGAQITGYARTGSGRRESYRYAPASRMRSTFIAPGTDRPEALFEGVDFGLYAARLGGGQVQPGTGDYNFAVLEGYLIRNGKVAEPVRGASLIGSGPETLQRIEACADNLTLGQGMCGSISGSVPTDVGQPWIYVSELTVGGQA
jgi:TldD protein